MTIVLLEYTADARDMLNCKLEQHQRHWCLADLVVVIQVAGERGGVGSGRVRDKGRRVASGGVRVICGLFLFLQ